MSDEKKKLNIPLNTDPRTWSWVLDRKEGVWELRDPIHGVLAYTYRLGTNNRAYRWELVGGERKGMQYSFNEAKDMAERSVHYRYVLGNLPDKPAKSR